MSSTPSVSLSILRTLHRIHGQLADLRERQDRGPKQVRANEAHVAHREQELARVRDEAKAMRMAADQKQLQLKTGEEKIKDLKRKLNAAASNREYQILLEQIAADDMAKSVLEDEIIEALEKIDQFQPQIGQAEAALATARQKVIEVRQEVQRQQPLIQGDMQRLEAELKECESVLPPPVRERLSPHSPPKGPRRAGRRRARSGGRTKQGRRLLQRLPHPSADKSASGDQIGASQLLQNVRPTALPVRGRSRREMTQVVRLFLAQAAFTPGARGQNVILLFLLVPFRGPDRCPRDNSPMPCPLKGPDGK